MHVIFDEYKPKCANKGCTRPAQKLGKRSTGGHYFRSVCANCYSDVIAPRHGLKNMKEVIAKKAGFDSLTEYLNSKHPYRKYRKDYCENTDGRLGYTCTTTVSMPAILQVDHINSNSSDNREENLQTLCACCHIHKTITNKDHLTPGRKALKIAKLIKLLEAC